MRISRQKSQLRLEAHPAEARLLGQVLSELIANYRLAPDQLDPKAARGWYSTRGCTAAKMSEEETREWVEHLHEVKSARLQLLEHLASRLACPSTGTRHLDLDLSAATELMAALNDHRLYLAGRHDIGQAEMDMRSEKQFATLPPPRRLALYGIHLLAQIVEGLLPHIAPEAAGWIEDV